VLLVKSLSWIGHLSPVLDDPGLPTYHLPTGLAIQQHVRLDWIGYSTNAEALNPVLSVPCQPANPSQASHVCGGDFYVCKSRVVLFVVISRFRSGTSRQAIKAATSASASAPITIARRLVSWGSRLTNLLLLSPPLKEAITKAPSPLLTGYSA